MTQARIKSVAAAIRLELDVLLADLSGDEQRIVNDDGAEKPSDAPNAERLAVAAMRLYSLDWLRGILAANDCAELTGAAKAALESLRGAGPVAAVAMHQKAGHVGWPAEYSCDCFDSVLDVLLEKEPT